jgi:hypothetical protein
LEEAQSEAQNIKFMLGYMVHTEVMEVEEEENEQG